MADEQVLDQEENLVEDPRIAELEGKVAVLEEKYKRALADYQNLERLQRESQTRLIKLATEEFVRSLLTPLEHLHLAAKHINDKGLSMVITQFQTVLEQQGLTEIEALGKPFDPETMEVIETREGKKEQVLEVVGKGYRLNGIVIHPAKVIVGTQKQA